MIPSCSDLVSLSIDIWTKSEETDGTRLIVAGDIGNKPLIVCDLQPPPVCRYLKVNMQYADSNKSILAVHFIMFYLRLRIVSIVAISFVC